MNPAIPVNKVNVSPRDGNFNNSPFDRDDWWQADGPFRLLHDINPVRMRWATSVVKTWLDKRLLDVGCGGGLFTETAARAGARAVGVDTAASAIDAAQKHAVANSLDITYRQQDGISQDPPGSYDIISCFEMLEHIKNPAAVVADCATLLAPGGIALFSTINRTLRAWALLIAGLEIAVKIIPAGTHQYQQFIKPQELADYCRKSGLAITAVCGLRYSFFGHCYLLDEKDTAVNYFLAAKRIS